jgi:dsDNA-specific endonuclease/ATPase MutS2
MDQKVLNKLEFDKIRKGLADAALSESGREAALRISPQTSAAAVRRLLDETSEAESVLIARSLAAYERLFGHYRRSFRVLKRVRNLGCRELLKALGVFKAARRARNGLKESGAESYGIWRGSSIMTTSSSRARRRDRE